MTAAHWCSHTDKTIVIAVKHATTNRCRLSRHYAADASQLTALALVMGCACKRYSILTNIRTKFHSPKLTPIEFLWVSILYWCQITKFTHQSLFTACNWNRQVIQAVAAGRGAKEGMGPGRHSAGSAFGWAKIRNCEIWQLLTNWRFHCRHPLTTAPYTRPLLGPNPNCQWSTTPHKAVCTPRNLQCWSDWSFTCCKTVENPYSSVNVLLAIAIQCFAVAYSRLSKFSMKSENFAWNLVIWLSGKSLNLLQPDVRF